MTVPVDTLRIGLRALREETTRNMAAMAQALSVVLQRKLYLGWGFVSFRDYVEQELGLSETYGRRLAQAYLTWAPVWDAVSQGIPLERLQEIEPLIRSGKLSLIEATTLAREHSSHWLRAYRESVLLPKPLITHRRAPIAPLWMDDEVRPLPLLRGLRVVDRDERRGPHAETVTFAMTVDRPIYEAWLRCLEAQPGYRPGRSLPRAEGMLAALVAPYLTSTRPLEEPAYDHDCTPDAAPDSPGTAPADAGPRHDVAPAGGAPTDAPPTTRDTGEAVRAGTAPDDGGPAGRDRGVAEGLACESGRLATDPARPGSEGPPDGTPAT